MKNSFFYMALAGGLAAFGAVAQPPEPGPGDPPPPGPGGREGRPNFHQIFDRADSDGDGKVSYEDIKAVAPRFPQERFDAFDKNADGTLTRNELPKPGERGPRPDGDRPGGPRPDGRGAPDEMRGPGGPGGPDGRGPGGRGGRENMLRRADTNQDKKVTLEEFKAFMLMEAEEHFRRLDSNGDGAITSEDPPPAGGPGRGPEGRPGPRPDGPPPAEAPAAAPMRQRERLLREADANADGKLTYEELLEKKPGFPEATFTQMDRNQDGALSPLDQQS